MSAPVAIDRTLLTVVLACAAATLFHHVHNAEFLGDYPNMPAWLSPAGIYLTWLSATLVGVAGYLLHGHGWRLTGKSFLLAYGCYCLDGLVHYALAPLAEHNAMMNLSIGMEAVTGVALLAVVVRKMGSVPI